MHFELEKTNTQGQARAGKLQTAHQTIETPIFMPVGTVGSVKAVHQHELQDDIKAQIILGNTYHLYLRPGLEVIKNAGGLHKFMNWNKAILTDSGGYQVFSLADNRKLTPEGAIFKSHIDGSKHIFTPENVIDTQRIIGSDIMMALDECTPYPCDYKYAKKSLDLTHKWLEQGFRYFEKTSPLYGFEQAYFPIVQGSVYSDLRKQSAEFVSQFDAVGYAIGGLSVGEPAEKMYEMTQLVTDILPKNKPRYLMGVGTPENILEGIDRGIDMFDCVMPTRNARNGMLFTQNGIINIKNAKWKNDFSEIDPLGTSYVDKKYSKAYLRHLTIANERLAAQIASIHNLAFYLWLVKEARKQILEDNFSKWKNEMITKISQRL